MSGMGKVRKNSTSAQGAAAMRPRANTISHVGNPGLDMFANGHMPSDSMHHQNSMLLFGHALQDGMAHTHGVQVPGHHGVPSGLPKLNTSLANHDMAGGLRTAPAFDHFNMDNLFSPDTTVNPAALHFPEPPHTAGLQSPGAFQDIHGMHGAHMGDMEMDPGMDWMGGFGHELQPFNTNDSNAIAGSSPSVMDSDSPDGASEYTLDRKPSLAQHTANWQSAPFVKTANALPDYMMDMGLSDVFAQNPPSPGGLPDFSSDGAFASPQFQGQNPFAFHAVNGFMGQPYPPSMNNGDSPSTLGSTTDTSGRHSSVGSGRYISIPEATRHAIMITLAQPGAMFGPRKSYSQPSISSPLSPGFAAKAQAAVTVPSTADLQRYIGAFLKYFHAHIPIFHLPTLNFETPLPSGFQNSGRSSSPVFNVANGGGCLILAMSAIGALYENEGDTSKALFNFSKRVLSTYLEERRKADISSAMSPVNTSASQSTPVWLVQAMLLNVVYGHMCGDKTAEMNAHTHGAALVSLARAANLLVPAKHGASDTHDEKWNARGEDPAWYEWRIAEEKKRTLYAVFNVSSLLTSAYNHPPALKNTEIALDLPCDEDLWAAESAEAWYAMGGSMAAEQNSVPFTLALGSLLSANERQQLPLNQMSQAFCNPQMGDQVPPGWPRAEFHASTYGCLVLINALHNYIWETRQRHVGRQWSSQETEDMHRRIEPALVAWQAVWSRIPHHSVEQPNPHGMGPLAGDSIPLLDLAYLTLYVNLGRSKECFWQRDFEEMSREIASGFELLQHVGQDGEQQNGSKSAKGAANGGTEQQPESQAASADASRKASRRERHLRKAAFHAANSLLLANRASATFADFGARELSIQQALCHFEDAQVLAEWMATLQERVGPYVGVLGLDPINLDDVPAVILLEPEDVQLMRQLDEILRNAEMKMAQSPALFSQNQPSPEDAHVGYSAKILQTMGRMLDGAGVWPVTKLMNVGLEVQAKFMKDRAEKSRSQT